MKNTILSILAFSFLDSCILQIASPECLKVKKKETPTKSKNDIIKK